MMLFTIDANKMMLLLLSENDWVLFTEEIHVYIKQSCCLQSTMMLLSTEDDHVAVVYVWTMMSFTEDNHCCLRLDNVAVVYRRQSCRCCLHLDNDVVVYRRRSASSSRRTRSRTAT